jgi:hypothetical protein
VTRVEQLLASQRKLAEDLLKATAPLTAGQREARPRDSSAAK